MGKYNLRTSPSLSLLTRPPFPSSPNISNTLAIASVCWACEMNLPDQTWHFVQTHIEVEGVCSRLDNRLLVLDCLACQRRHKPLSLLGRRVTKQKIVVVYQMVSKILLLFLGKHLKYKAEGVTGKMNGCRFYGEWLRHAM